MIAAAANCTRRWASNSRFFRLIAPVDLPSDVLLPAPFPAVDRSEYKKRLKAAQNAKAKAEKEAAKAAKAAAQPAKESQRRKQQAPKRVEQTQPPVRKPRESTPSSPGDETLERNIRQWKAVQLEGALGPVWRSTKHELMDR